MNQKKNSCLVGFSGFVGGNLKNQAHFDLHINSKNSFELPNKDLSYLVFAGARAEKWKANQNPESDTNHIDELIEILKTVKADQAVLISTIDVYAETAGKIETDSPEADNHAYGLNRSRLEIFFSSHFKNSHIIRLPALFGHGLKKNIIYDFLNNNQIHKIDSRSHFQFYDLKKLNSDINKVLAENIKVLNLATEPISAGEIALLFSDTDFHNELVQKHVHYDFKSKYSYAWSRGDGYLYSKDQILACLKEFVEKYKK